VCGGVQANQCKGRQNYRSCNTQQFGSEEQKVLILSLNVHIYILGKWPENDTHQRFSNNTPQRCRSCPWDLLSALGRIVHLEEQLGTLLWGGRVQISEYFASKEFYKENKTKNSPFSYDMHILTNTLVLLHLEQ
jgi:hypothetical protein